jgi:hypothetical protein
MAAKDSNLPSEFDFNDRYGIRTSRAWVSYAVAFALLGGGWLIWSALDHADPKVSSSLISFNVSDPRKVEIRYSVTRRDGAQPVTCTVVARDYDVNVVGQLDDVIPAGARSVERSLTIPTRADAVNAAVIRCFIKP